MKSLLTAVGAAVAAGAFMWAAPAFADLQLNMPEGVTTSSRDIYGLHMQILLVCALIAAGVYAAMIIAIVRFRKSAHSTPAKFSHNGTVEVIWTVIPAAILIAMALPAAETLIRLEDTRDSELTIKITGYQWQWQYEFIDYDVAFFSRLDQQSNIARQPGSELDPRDVENYLLEVDQRVVVPVDTKIRVLVTAADVLHSWWMPDFGVKKDAIPGFVNETWFEATETGVFRGQCAELCGMDHGFMPIVVEVVSREEFSSWLTAMGGSGPVFSDQSQTEQDLRAAVNE